MNDIPLPTPQQALEAMHALHTTYEHALIAHYLARHTSAEYHLTQLRDSFLRAADALGLEVSPK